MGEDGQTKYEPYPVYKASGVSWLGDIPSGWNDASLRWFSRIFSGGTPSKTVSEYWENGTIPWLNSGAVNQVEITTPSAYISKSAFSNSSAKWIPKNSLVLALAGQGKTKGMVAYTKIDTTCNQSMAAIVSEADKNAKYYFWWISSNYQNIRNMAGGDLRDGLNLQLLGSIPCPIPSLQEQTKIAGFLDYETAKIDALIAKQQRLIALLEEKRQAVISHAVTKGLDPTTRLRASGVNWLGDIPEHWELVQSRRLFGQRTERARPKDRQLTASQKYGVIFQSDFMTREGKRVVQVIKGADILKHVEPNDFIISMRSFQGGLELCRDQGSMSSAYVALTPIKHVSTDFFYFLFKSKQYIQALQATTNLVRDGQALRYENFSLVPLPIIPDAEQKDIATYLEKQADRFSTLTDKAQTAIILLKERRTALISAAVTGKIDLRNWQPPEAASNNSTQDINQP